MSDDWDADDFEPPPPVIQKEPVKSQWDDEDKEEEPVKESWEDEEGPPKPKPAEKKKTKAKAAENEKDKEAAEQDKPLDDPVAEKLRQQRLVEEADFRTAKELFGQGKEAKALDDFIPKTEADFIEYAELLASKATPFNKSFHYQTLLKSFLRKATATMTAAEAKEVSAAATVIANEKLKAEKEAAGGKKKGGPKKKELKVDREVDDFSAKYDDAVQDDFDFM